MQRLRRLVRALRDQGSDEAFALASALFRRLYKGRYPLYWPGLDWLSDEPLWRTLAAFGEAPGLNAHRRHFLREASVHCMRKIGGNTAECGAFMGLGSYLICDAHRHNAVPARHYVFDSFEGLSKPSALDGSYWRAGDLACSEQEVRRRLAAFDFVELKKGWIPDRFGDVADEEFCFVHIDVDLAGPTLDSLHFFFPRLKRGGWIIIDDYGFRTCPGATDVVQQFIAKTDSASLIALPAGGAAVLKLE